MQLELWQAAFELENSNHRQNRNGSSPGPLSKQAEANQSKGDQSWQRKVQEEADAIKKINKIKRPVGSRTLWQKVTIENLAEEGGYRAGRVERIMREEGAGVLLDVEVG